jgi:hypothetical protein
MRSFNGVAVSEPVADGFGEIAEASHLDVVVVAAGLEPAQRPINSRRVAATAVQASGAAPGAPPSLPPLSQASRRSLNPDTEPPAAGAAVIAGAAAAGATAAVAGADTIALAAAAVARDFTGVDARSGTGAAGAALWGATTAADAAPPFDATAVAEAGSLIGAVVCAAGGASFVALGFSTTTGAPPPRTTGAESEAAGAVPEPRESAPVPAVAPAPVVSVEPDRVSRAPPCEARDGLEVDDPPVLWSDPVDPATPVVSAYAATGTETTAAPIPNATARAPTRPTYRAYVDGVDSLISALRRTGVPMRRTRPPGFPGDSCRSEEQPERDDAMADLSRSRGEIRGNYQSPVAVRGGD